MLLFFSFIFIWFSAVFCFFLLLHLWGSTLQSFSQQTVNRGLRMLLSDAKQFGTCQLEPVLQYGLRDPVTWGCCCRCPPESLRSGSLRHSVAPAWSPCWWPWPRRSCGSSLSPGATRGKCHCWCVCRSHVATCCHGYHQWHFEQSQTQKVRTVRPFPTLPGFPL